MNRWVNLGFLFLQKSPFDELNTRSTTMMFLRKKQEPGRNLDIGFQKRDVTVLLKVQGGIHKITSEGWSADFKHHNDMNEPSTRPTTYSFA